MGRHAYRHLQFDATVTLRSQKCRSLPYSRTLILTRSAVAADVRLVQRDGDAFCQLMTDSCQKLNDRLSTSIPQSLPYNLQADLNMITTILYRSSQISQPAVSNSNALHHQTSAVAPCASRYQPSGQAGAPCLTEQPS